MKFDKVDLQMQCEVVCNKLNKYIKAPSINYTVVLVREWIHRSIEQNRPIQLAL